ncbi:hypothetical protein [Phenylobacterium sp.]|uniref:hypothetical protein n=1 Tax=Phenylobacterium sp. TaxID=1871053 RepID=UPI00120165E6|nr:hypothetical protein [Phenylobacterium sp.]THD60775.1 MAG: hypothetical protein E8A49_13085 [Phenylobacterium sp.]
MKLGFKLNDRLGAAMRNLMASISLAFGMVAAAPAMATVLINFNNVSVAPGEALALGPTYDVGQYQFRAVISGGLPGQFTPCVASDCLSIGSSTYDGVDNPGGNFLFVKSGYSLVIEDTTGANLIVRNGEIGALEGVPFYADAIMGIDPANKHFFDNESFIDLTPISSDLSAFRFTTAAYVPADVANVVALDLTATVSGGSGRALVPFFVDNLQLSETIPEVPTWISLILGFGMLGANLQGKWTAKAGPIV